jgi:hypothetical protein
MERKPGHGSRQRSDFEEYGEDGIRNKKFRGNLKTKNLLKMNTQVME